MNSIKKWMALFPLVAGLAACDDFALVPGKDQMGELRWVLEKEAFTKAAEEMPDTSDFLLTVKDVGGNILYDGPYGDSPEALAVLAGSYTVSVVSIPFTSPAFSRPQYGDEQVVVVSAGQTATVRLNCKLLNAGIRLRTASDFLTAYPDGVLYVSQDNVKLAYMYAETRTAYMKPGQVSVLLYNQGQFETLLTRTLEAREILTLNISAPGVPGQGGSSIRVAVDTTKVWSHEQYVIGSGNGGNTGTDPDNALSVGEAAAHVGEDGVWIYGYVVGGDLSSNGATVTTSGISKKTHLALAERSSVTAKSSCVAVELPQGKVRDALNLVDHPDLVGTRIYVKGKLVESYFGTTGLKGTNDFALK